MIVKKSKLLLGVLFLNVVFLGGCETAAGATKGIASGIGSTAEGVGKDAYNSYNFIMAIDNWIKKNLW